MEQEPQIKYDVISQFAGHQTLTCSLTEGAQHMYGLKTNKGMQIAINGVFASVGSMQELKEKLATAKEQNQPIRVYDENIGG